jgi:site-specific DNA-cytosine methylase
VDLLICSPPYQNLKFNNDRLSSDCVDNKLFNKFIDILFTVKPKYFVLEHMTSMTTHNLYYISAVLNNIAPTLLDAKDFSAHRRERFFWVGKLNNEGKYEKVDLILPYGNSKMVLNDVLDFNYQPNKYRDISEMIPSSNVRMYNANYIRLGTIGKDGQGNRVYAPEGKAISLVANAGGAGPITGLYKINDKIRTLSCLECERLQGLPDGYTLGFKDTPRKRMLGNCSQVNLIEYVLKNIFN